jgi:DNA-binding HxlR family transcriptional regulator
MTTKRTYEDACRFAHALDLVGERWALLVIRELLLGPKRFTDLREGLVTASPNILTQRLRDLQEAGVVQRRKLAPPAGSWVYELTEWGLELETVVTALGRWGARSPNPPQEKRSSIDAMVIAFRSLFDAEAAADLTASYELVLGEDHFHVDVIDGWLEVGRGPATAPVATLETDPGTLAALLSKERSIDDVIGAGDLKVNGGKAAAQRFFALFPMPEPAAALA